LFDPIRRARRMMLRPALLAAVLLGLPAAGSSQAGGPPPAAVEPGRFDMGRMWTFEHAPAQYFGDAYGFDANAAWFASARLSVLRIPGCSS
jgi:hypothetical protein